LHFCDDPSGGRQSGQKAKQPYAIAMNYGYPASGEYVNKPENDAASILQPIELSGCSDGF